MTDTPPPLRRSIGLRGVILFIIAVTAAVTVGAAAADGRYVLAGVAAAFFVGATVAGLMLRRRT